MGRRILIMLIVLITFTAPCVPAMADSDSLSVELEARSALLVHLTDDSETEEIIYDLRSDELIYPASTMKMLTALTALDLADPEEEVTVGLEYLLIPSDASRAGLKPFMKLTVRDLLKGLLLSSGADAAYTLACYCGGKLIEEDELSPFEALESFVKAMNDKAAAIGAVHTTAANADGYDAEGQLTTTRDLLILAKAFLDQPLLAGICALPRDKITVKVGKIKISFSVVNTNQMLLEDSIYYNKDAIGIKTGTTSLAGGCLVSAFQIQGETYICIVMNSSDEGRYEDTKKLYALCSS